MKTKNILISALALSNLGSISRAQENPDKFKQDLSKAVLKDTQAIREIRTYNNHSEEQKQEYDNKVKKITECFVDAHPGSEKWNEKKVILKIHECALQNNYPNTTPVNKEWKKGSTVIIDTTTSKIFTQFKKLYEKYDDFPIANINDAELKFEITEIGKTESITASLDDELIMFSKISDDKNTLEIRRSSIVERNNVKETDEQKKDNVQKIVSFLNNGEIVQENLDVIANKLLKGLFKKQEHAINMLLDYKILSSMVFSIEDRHGTQFKNIVKMNYLTETIKEKYPNKINKNLNIPHIVSSPEIDHLNNLRNPETILFGITPQDFKKIQKQQIAQELNKHTEL